MKASSCALFLCRLAGGIALSLGSGCAPRSESGLRVGINAWPGYEFLYLAQEKGYYRDEGLDVRLVEFSSLSDCRRSYERGQIDVMGTTAVEVLMTRDQSSRSPQVVYVVDYSNGADVILAREASRTAASLRGARIGVEMASLGIYVLARGLDRAGLSLADVRAESMDQASMEEAFRKGELDAVVSYPPTSVRLLRDPGVHAVFSTAEIPGEVVDVIAVEAGVAAERPAAVVKMLRAFDRAVRYARENPVEANRIMADREGITPDEFAGALVDGIRLVSPPDQASYLNPGGKLDAVFDRSNRILRQSGQIKGADRHTNASNPALVPTEPMP